MKRSLGIILVSLTASCSTSPKPYNGLTGYQISKAGATTRLSYTTEAKTPERKLQELAQKACGKALGAESGRASLAGITVTKSEKEVEILVPVMLGTVQTGQFNQPSSFGGSISTVQGSINSHERVLRKVELKSLEAECTPVAGSAL